MRPLTPTSNAYNISRQPDHLSLISHCTTPSRTVPTPTDADYRLLVRIAVGIYFPTLAHSHDGTLNPEDGDIVVREEQRESKVVYVLHTAPGADQYVLRSRKDAVAQACAVAKHEHVRAWVTDGDYDFTLLEDFRIVESV